MLKSWDSAREQDQDPTGRTGLRNPGEYTSGGGSSEDGHPRQRAWNLQITEDKAVLDLQKL